MRLFPAFICKRIHYGHFMPAHGKSIKLEGNRYDSAFICPLCETIRYIRYRFCKQCKRYMKRGHFHITTEEGL